jgi:HemY protein
MIRFYLLLLLTLVLGAAAANFLIEDNGYVLIAYRQWLLETSVAGLVGALAFIVLVLLALLRLLRGAWSLPRRIREAVESRRADKARDSFEGGLLRLLEGSWKRAEIELVRRAADHHAAHLNYLAAARAAQRLGAGERRDHYLKLAAQSAPEIELAALLTQAELQRERGEFEHTRDTALQIRVREPKHPYAVELLAESYAALGAWEPLRQLLAEPTAQGALAPARHRELLVRALRELIGQARTAASLEQVRALWNAAPAEARGNPLLRRDYAAALAQLNAHAEALALVTATLDKEWDAELATLYGELHASEPVSQLAAVEHWLQQHGERPELLVTAGRACLRNKLWGKARSYLEAVTRLAPSAAAYLELARLCEQTQSPDEATRFYRQGLELAAQRG